MPVKSLIEAIENKYGQDDDNGIESSPLGIYAPRISARKSFPRLLILNDCGVDNAGENENQLKKILNGVLEIDLAHNIFTEWNEISKILNHCSNSLTFLNLSFNVLSTPLPQFCLENNLNFPKLSRLTVLILNGSKISWDSVWFLLKKAKSLQEIHLSLNDFDCVDIKCRSVKVETRPIQSENVDASHSSADNFPGTSSSSVSESNKNHPQISSAERHISESSDSGIERGESRDLSDEDSGNGSSSEEEQDFIFPHIRKVFLNENKIGWEDVNIIGSIFPSLRHIGLTDCSIKNVSENAHEKFENLQSLTLTNSLIEDIKDIANLAKFPSISDLRIQGIPCFSDMTAHERRQILIAMLPNIKKLNGGAPITSEEREDSERAFIRRYLNEQNPPQRYNELVAKHGALAPLVDLSLAPKTQAKIHFTHGENTFERHIKLYQTTQELKVSLESLVGIQANKMKLFYVDLEMRGVFGQEEMKFPQKQLYSYNMQDGDEIIVELKNCFQSSLSNSSTGSPPK